MALRTKEQAAPLPTVRFFSNGKQVYQRETNRAFVPGDVVELFGTPYEVDRQVVVTDLATDRDSTNVILVPEGSRNPYADVKLPPYISLPTASPQPKFVENEE